MLQKKNKGKIIIVICEKITAVFEFQKNLSKLDRVKNRATVLPGVHGGLCNPQGYWDGGI